MKIITKALLIYLYGVVVGAYAMHVADREEKFKLQLQVAETKNVMYEGLLKIQTSLLEAELKKNDHKKTKEEPTSTTNNTKEKEVTK